MSLARRAGQVAGAAGVAAAGAAGVGWARSRRRSHGSHGPEASSAGEAHADGSRTVAASDGTVLHVEVEEPEQPPGEGEVTVVLCHGFCLDLTAWRAERDALVAAGRRVVLWDQRGHGRSEAGGAGSTTIDQLGRDLRAVLDAVAPDGPLVLVGHSMGGMTIISLAGHYPDLVRERVRGVALVSTSAGGTGLVKLGLGAILDVAAVRLGPGVLAGLARRGEVWTGLRRAGRRLETTAVQRYGFGGPVDPAVLRQVSDLIFGTSLSTIGALLPQLDELDIRASLPGLVGTPVLVLVGSDDQLTPAAHSQALVDALPDAEHVVVEGAGHLLPMERPDVLAEAVDALIRRVGDAAAVAARTTTRTKGAARTRSRGAAARGTAGGGRARRGGGTGGTGGTGGDA